MKPIRAAVSEPIAAVSAAVAGGTSSVVAVVALSGGAGVGGQLAVVLAMGRIAKCGSEDDEEEEEEGLPLMMHPLRFSLGSGPGGQVAAAAISNTLLIPLAFSLAAFFVAPALMAAAGGGDGGRRHQRAAARARIGWPSVLLFPFGTLAEGSAAAITEALRSDTLHVIFFGAVGVTLLAAFCGVYSWAMARHLPRRRLVLQNSGSDSDSDAEGEDAEKAPAENYEGGLRDELRRAVSSPKHWFAPGREWAAATKVTCGEQASSDQQKGDEAERILIVSADGLGPQGTGSSPDQSASVGTSTEADVRFVEARLAQYAHFIGDSRWLYAEYASFLCSVIVGIAEGLPDSSHTYSFMCELRVGLAAAATISQCLLALGTTVPLELLIQLAIAGCTIPIAAMAVVVVTSRGDGVGGFADDAASALALLETLAGIFSLALMAFQLLTGMAAPAVVAVAGALRSAYGASAPRRGGAADGGGADTDDASASVSMLVMAQPLLESGDESRPISPSLVPGGHVEEEDADLLGLFSSSSSSNSLSGGNVLAPLQRLGRSSHSESSDSTLDLADFMGTPRGGEENDSDDCLLGAASPLMIDRTSPPPTAAAVRNGGRPRQRTIRQRRRRPNRSSNNNNSSSEDSAVGTVGAAALPLLLWEGGSAPTTSSLAASEPASNAADRETAQPVGRREPSREAVAVHEIVATFRAHERARGSRADGGADP